MDIKPDHDAVNGINIVRVAFSDLELAQAKMPIIDQLIDKVTTHLANRFIAEHGQEVLDQMNPKALANLAIAKSLKRLDKEFFS